MSQTSAYVLGIALLAGAGLLVWWGGPLAILAAILAAFFICEALADCGLPPPRDD